MGTGADERLTILSMAFPFAPVGPPAVGGAEQVLSDLDEALVAAGHRSVVVACAGSRPAGALYSFPLDRAGMLEDTERAAVRARRQEALDRALANERIDLIHLHGMDLDQYRLPKEIPVLLTLHLPIEWYRPEMLERARERAVLQCVSRSQRRTCPPHWGEVPVVENGVALPPPEAKKPRGNFALALGRICPEKNVHAALEAGTRAGVPVKVGGRVYRYREHQEYFEAKVEPLLRGVGRVRHEFLGPVLPERKRELLGEARCLLHPTLAPETSSLVAMEAMAAGTPVIAYRSGALPEIVEDGVTGFLVENEEEMARAIGKVERVDPEACRERAERCFSRERMVRDYFSLYQRLLHKRSREKVYAG